MFSFLTVSVRYNRKEPLEAIIKGQTQKSTAKSTLEISSSAISLTLNKVFNIQNAPLKTNSPHLKLSNQSFTIFR